MLMIASSNELLDAVAHLATLAGSGCSQATSPPLLLDRLSGPKLFRAYPRFFGEKKNVAAQPVNVAFDPVLVKNPPSSGAS